MNFAMKEEKLSDDDSSSNQQNVWSPAPNSTANIITQSEIQFNEDQSRVVSNINPHKRMRLQSKEGSEVVKNNCIYRNRSANFQNVHAQHENNMVSQFLHNCSEEELYGLSIGRRLRYEYRLLSIRLQFI